MAFGAADFDVRLAGMPDEFLYGPMFLRKTGAKDSMIML